MFKYFSLEVPVEKRWIINLMEEYKEYLEVYHKDQKAVRQHLLEALKIFWDMERAVLLPYELTYGWFETRFAFHNTTKAKRSMIAFLLDKKLIKKPEEEQKYRELFERSLSDCPDSFKKAIVLYYEEKLKLRKRQTEQNARNPVKLKTIEADVGALKRMVKWMQKQYSDAKSWFDVTEEMVNSFLLSLTPSNRECMRKDFYQFFKLAKKKRCTFDIPMTDYKTREVPRVNYVLTFMEQSRLAHKIRNEGINLPYEALLTSLAFYHALQSRYISSIKMDDVDAENEKIYMKEIPDIYLSPVEMSILKEYLIIRKEFPNSIGRTLLFIQRCRGAAYGEVPIDKTFIRNCVKRFSGYNPMTLRITCLTEMANYFGPQFLREAYGVSQTHASRFGKYEDYLLEETLKELLD